MKKILVYVTVLVFMTLHFMSLVVISYEMVTGISMGQEWGPIYLLTTLLWGVMAGTIQYRRGWNDRILLILLQTIWAPIGMFHAILDHGQTGRWLPAPNE